MSVQPWRVVTQGPIRSAAAERGPRTPIGDIRYGAFIEPRAMTPVGWARLYAMDQKNHGNRGDSSGSEQYGWRDHLGRYTWSGGFPPAPVGVVCDEHWRPLPLDEVPAAAVPLGGYTRSEMKGRAAYATRRP